MTYRAFKGGSWAPWRLVKRTTFTDIPKATNEQLSGRRQHMLPDGRLMVAYGASTYRVVYYDPVTDTWTNPGHTWNAITNGSGVIPNVFWNGLDGLVYCVRLNNLHSLNPATGVTTSTALDASNSGNSMAVGLDNGLGLCISISDGNNAPTTTVLTVDPVTLAKTVVAPIPVATYAAGITKLADGRVWVGGGINASNVNLATARIYDPVANTWTAVANIPRAMYLFKACTLPSGDVLIQGGFNDTTLFGEFFVYNVGTNTWSEALAVGTLDRDGLLFTHPQGPVMVVYQANSTLATFDPASRQFASYWKV